MIGDRPTSAMAEADRRRVVVEWNDTRRDLPRGASVPRAIEAQAARSPGAVALVAGDRRLTYRELNARANRLARKLKRLGVGPDVPVGIHTGRVPEFAVAVLATLKAGGVCLPLDPAYPPARLAEMLEDSGAAALLTLRDLPPIATGGEAAVVRLDDELVRTALAGESGEDLDEGPEPEQASYLIYTSGSTGRPKGVVLTHRGLVNHALAAVDLYGLTPADRVLQFASLSFDISLEETLPAWCAGATVVLRPEVADLSARPFGRLVDRRKITVLDLPTAFWEAWSRELAAGGGSVPRSLRLVIVGGERATAQARSAWLARGGRRVRWVNTYGPTEATVIATSYEPRGDEVDAEDPPIGRPIANTRVYILDEDRLPVPVGATGELYIGGDGVARGYHNRPDLTAERFVDDPFGDQPDARLYRTGDLGRWRSDGAIEFLGRVDQQVKIRGFRIEPGEIEAALCEEPGVRQAVVVAREDVPGARRLVAYLVADGGLAPSTSDLRRRLGETLPDYMVPSAFVVLPGLPMTPNGKVDRRALPAPSGDRPDLEGSYQAPRDRLEARLAAIWEEILGVRPIGVTDNIFDLGIDSMAAARLFVKVEKVFGRKLPPAPLFQAPTIERLADHLRERRGTGRWTSLVPIQPDGTSPPLFCVHGGAGTIIHFHELARLLGPDQPFYGLQARGLYGGVRPLKTVEEMASHYVSEIRSVRPEGPYYLAGFCFGGLVALEMAHQLRAQGHEVPLLTLLNTPKPAFEGAAPIDRPVGPQGGTPRRGRLARLRAELRPLSLASRAAFLRVKIGRFLRRRARKISWRAFEVLGLPMPDAIRDLYFLGTYARAEAVYRPRPIPGRIALFLGEGVFDDAPDAWRALAGGSFEVVRIPGDHAGPDPDHPIYGAQRYLMKEPAVGLLADRLRARLDRAFTPGTAGDP